MTWIFYLVPVVAMIGGVSAIVGFIDTIETSFEASRSQVDL